MFRISLALLFLVSAASAAELPFTTTNQNTYYKLVDYFDTAVSTNHPLDTDSDGRVTQDYPWRQFVPVNDTAIHIDWQTNNPPSEAEFLAADAERGLAILAAVYDSREDYAPGSRDVRDAAASNIVVLASAYGVTNQPISWAAVANAMQVERIDATASNDVMRLLTVIGDGTTLLSFKEFYSENGGDAFNVRWP